MLARRSRGGGKSADFTWRLGRGEKMSLLDHPFDPAREAALVSGAGNGTGRAIAQALVGEGVRAVFADLREDAVAAAVKSSPRPRRRPRADGARGAFEPGVGLCHGRRDRGRRRAVADELVRAAGAG